LNAELFIRKEMIVMIKPRCKKCGKVLSDPESIARGIGPKCAGISSGGRSMKVRIIRPDGSRYSLVFSGGLQATLPIEGTATKIQSEREPVICTREERRRLFEERKPFQCGLMLPERKPIIYTPTVNGDWKNNSSESVIPHDQLQTYLKRYQLI
jgi:Family of unknown function (DUF6011)